jgi:hypothetical protein
VSWVQREQPLCLLTGQSRACWAQLGLALMATQSGEPGETEVDKENSYNDGQDRLGRKLTSQRTGRASQSLQPCIWALSVPLRRQAWLGGPGEVATPLWAWIPPQPRGCWEGQKAVLLGQCLILSLPAPHPQGRMEMSFLQLLGAEVTPAWQITGKVEQCPLARWGQGWGQWARGQPQAG